MNSSTVSLVEPDLPTQRRRRLPWRPFWRSPADQPPWARPALLGIAAVAALLYSWNIADSGFAVYTSTAVRTMAGSWHALLYGALDPGATVTMDKLAGAFVPQALAVRVLGYHPWVLTLPQVVEGVVTVLVMYRIGRRWLGPTTGLTAAALFTTTPVVASMFGHQVEDCLLTMCLVLAADAFHAALVEDSGRPLVRCAVWIGIGFQAKMLQAWMVLPAMALVALLFAAGTPRRRLTRLVVPGAVLLAVSVSWIALHALTPAGDRPYADGSTTNSMISTVFGYDGFNRFPVHVSGAGPSPFFASIGEPPRAGVPDVHRVARAIGGPGGDQPWTKLLLPGYGSQVGWLYPLALGGLVLGLVRYRHARRDDPTRAGFVLWGAWLATFAAVFSVILTPHVAYLAALAPPVAALAAAGIVLAWRAYRDGARAWWALPVLIVAELGWAVRISSAYAGFLPWLVWTAVACGVPAAAVLVAYRLRPLGGPARAVPVAAAVGVLAMVAVPSGWSLAVLHPDYRGSEFDTSAGPVARMNEPGRVPGANDGPGLFANVSDVRHLPPPLRQFADYMLARTGDARFVAATDGWLTASPFITATGRPFVPMGGFSGALGAPSLSQVQRWVAAGDLRYVLLTPFSLGKGPGLAAAPTPLTAIVRWVSTTCTDVTMPALVPMAAPPGGPGAVPAGGSGAVPPGSPGAVPPGSPVAVPSGSPVAVPSGSPVAVPSGSPVAVPPGSPVAVPSGTPAAVPPGGLPAAPGGGIGFVLYQCGAGH